MKIEYDILFIPSGVDPENVNDVRSVKVETNSRFDTHEELKKEARNEAVTKRKIDKYALRKGYWRVACCELKVVNSPWDNTKELSDYLKDNHNVKSISKIRDSWSHESVECIFDSVPDRKEEEKKLQKKYKNLPISNKMNYLRVTLRAKGNISINDTFEKTKSVFKEAGF